MSSPQMRQAVVTVVLLSSSAWWFPPALAQERVIGLLALPGVFGRGACDRFAPRPVALHDTPQGRGSGTVLVLEPWTHDSRGGCEGLEVGVRVPGAAAVEQLPTKEYAYEAPWRHRAGATRDMVSGASGQRLGVAGIVGAGSPGQS